MRVNASHLEQGSGKPQITPSASPTSPICLLCGHPEDDHAAHGDWCPSWSEDELFSSKHTFTQAHSGKFIEGLQGLVAGTQDQLLVSYSIDTICEILKALPPAELPHCGICESSYGLFPCKGCNTFFCTGCKADHVCGSGPEAGQGRF